MNFIINEVIELCTLFTSFYCGFVYKQGPIDAGFSERLKLKDAVVMSHHTSVSNCFHYVITIALKKNYV